MRDQINIELAVKSKKSNQSETHIARLFESFSADIGALEQKYILQDEVWTDVYLNQGTIKLLILRAEYVSDDDSTGVKSGDLAAFRWDLNNHGPERTENFVCFAGTEASSLRIARVPGETQALKVVVTTGGTV